MSISDSGKADWPNPHAVEESIERFDLKKGRSTTRMLIPPIHYCNIVDNLIFSLLDRGPAMSATDFDPIIDTTRRAEIVSMLKRAILTGKLEPGQKLNELRISEQMRVSRAPLREAMRELVQEGILTSIPYAGTFVIE